MDKKEAEAQNQEKAAMRSKMDSYWYIWNLRTFQSI